MGLVNPSLSSFVSRNSVACYEPPSRSAGIVDWDHLVIRKHNHPEHSTWKSTKIMRKNSLPEIVDKKNLSKKQDRLLQKKNTFKKDSSTSNSRDILFDVHFLGVRGFQPGPKPLLATSNSNLALPEFGEATSTQAKGEQISGMSFRFNIFAYLYQGQSTPYILWDKLIPPFLMMETSYNGHVKTPTVQWICDPHPRLCAIKFITHSLPIQFLEIHQNRISAVTS